MKRVFVDKGYRGKKHHPEGVDVSEQKEVLSNYDRRLIRRRSSVEAVIGHLKSDCRMGRNFLHGEQGGTMNALLSESGQNVRRLMREVKGLPYFLFFFFKKY